MQKHGRKPPSDRLRLVWLEPKYPLLWINALGFFIYFQTLWFSLTGWDDLLLLQSVDRLAPGFSGLIQAFRSNAFVAGAGTFYRPVLTASFMADALLGAGISFNFVTNIVFHLVAVSLLYLVLLELDCARRPAFLFSLVFALHPALASAVAWIPGRNDTLLGAFALASFLFLIKFVRDEKARYGYWHLFFFALALFTKETALALVIVYPLYIFLAARKSPLQLRYGILGLFWILTTALWAYLRSHAVIAPQYLSAAGMLRNPLATIEGLLQFLGKAFLPFNLSVLPLLQSSGVVLGLCAASALAFGIYLSRGRRTRMAIFGLLFFLVLLVPTMISAASGQSAALVQLEHRLYLPLAGLILAIMETDAAKWLSENRTVSKTMVVGVLLACAVLTFQHSRDFRNESSFWNNARRHSPEVAFVHVYNAGKLVQQGMQTEAASEFETALALNPREFAALVNLSNLEYARGEYGKAEALLMRALPEEPGNPEAKTMIRAALERIREHKKYVPGTPKSP